jgi:DNA-binding beta-propeller fold protein YncE
VKREVSPVIAVIGIVVALAVVELFYWQRLMTQAERMAPGGRGAGGPAAEGAAPTGDRWAEVVTLAGDGEPGYRDGSGREARFDGPAGVAVDGAGMVFVADSRNHLIRSISPRGEVGTLAGVGGEQGYRDGPAMQARFSAPAGVALAPDGSVLVADTGNHMVRRVARDGRVTTLAGAETERDDLRRALGGYREGPASVAEFKYPVGLAVDGNGTVYVADAGNGRVRRISAGQVTTVPVKGELKSPTEVALADGRLWVSDSSGAVWYGPAAGPLSKLELEDRLSEPAGIAVALPEGQGPTLYLAQSKTNSVWRWRDGQMDLLAGQASGTGGQVDGTGDRARFQVPAGMVLGPGGALYVADFGNNCVRKVTLGPETGRWPPHREGDREQERARSGGERSNAGRGRRGGREVR